MYNTNDLQNVLDFLDTGWIVDRLTETPFFSVYDLIPNKKSTLLKLKRVLPDINALTKNKFYLDTSNGIQLKLENKTRNIIYSSDFLQDIADDTRPEILTLIIGLNENGQKVFYDLVKMPHLLVAGSTGSGKSVFIHNCILSLLYGGKSTLVLIDVKRVEFSIYENIPQLVAPIAFDSNQAYRNLKNLVYEMEKRYKLLQDTKCRNIEEYREKGYKLNYITLFIDELADLIMQNKKIESLIIRLCQLGRAAGIHLIVATQRPDSSILSGLIRINIPSRVCFAVQKATDSRIILDTSGGENLTGCGDGLFLPIGSKKPERIQGPYISTDILEKTIDMIRK